MDWILSLAKLRSRLCSAWRFEAFFKKDLARRLLLSSRGAGASEAEAELLATSFLREECGAAYTAGEKPGGVVEKAKGSKGLVFVGLLGPHIISYLYIFFFFSNIIAYVSYELET